MANVITSGVGTAFTIFASAARTATPNTSEIELPQGVRQGYFVIDVTAATSTPSTVFSIYAVDRVSGKTILLLASAAIVGTGTTTLRINDALTAVTNTVAKDALPPVIRVDAVHGNANSQTYTMSGMVGK